MLLLRDAVHFSWYALTSNTVRTFLMLLAMSIGVGSVVILTALGEGARNYITNEFSSLGTNLIIVIPGRSETSGGDPATMLGVTERDLTLDDALALTRHPQVRRIAPLNIGGAEISWQGRKREVSIQGTSAQFLKLRQWKMAQGKFLPDTDLQRPQSVCVIGSNIRNEIFGVHAALGKWLRIGDRRFRVIGILASEGQSLGIDVSDSVIIPVASAQSLFNLPSLFRVFVEVKTREAIPKVMTFIKNTLRDRHQGEDDVTVITQDAVLATFDRILTALTYAVGGIAAISLAVAGILIMNVMLVTVSQRTSEIGLLKSLGASGKAVLKLILIEAVLLSSLGAVFGFILGQAGSWIIRYVFPVLPAYPPTWAIVASLLVALGTGVLFSLLPARKAARLNPVDALMRR
ncbi:ABC-type antimicrobial peptide transport system, permease component [hydrothermal vent metagenome]|uniref:ABC-type antimicrobial peptide transport system, permease component n=1 Tax=hydrothermal vent metagenome TaxID=652676 RepID=A0A3B1A094_9ZZZZ